MQDTHRGNMHAITRNLGGLTPAGALRLLRDFRKERIQPYSSAFVACLQEVIVENGKTEYEQREIQMVAGKQEHEWRGTAVAHSSEFQHCRVNSCKLDSAALYRAEIHALSWYQAAKPSPAEPRHATQRSAAQRSAAQSNAWQRKARPRQGQGKAAQGKAREGMGRQGTARQASKRERRRGECVPLALAKEMRVCARATRSKQR